MVAWVLELDLFAYAFMSVAALGFLGSVGDGYLGDKFVNDYIKYKIDSLLKEFNLE